MNNYLYQLKITLLKSKPPIWRRFTVPSTFTLDNLHDVVQIVMGWTDSHLHEFIIDAEHYTNDPEGYGDGLPSNKYRLNRLIFQEGQTFSYIYDFGDYWVHKIVVEKILPVDSTTEEGKEVTCITGKRASPPEDVGGIYGYMEFCEAIKDSEHKEHDSYVEWVGEDFDPNEFDIDYINIELDEYMSKSPNKR
ncbi:MAG: plasmid pRiA4b ORF-3 family protein [Spirochaetia bacterium]|nr:plasmid pRiA4b ORF-3 family protein [Spirochaetia bacterium]